MGIKINTLESGAGAEIMVFDVIYGCELILAHEIINHDKSYSGLKYCIIDQSKCTEYNVTWKDIISIAELDQKASELNPNRIVAVVEPENMEFNLTELWQSHVEEFGLRSKSFISRELATQWIMENK